MGKVFRIHSEGATTNDWFSSGEINSNLIGTINTDGGDGKKLPTSIPSPFARIDLVRTAFAIVGTSGELDGIIRNGIATASDNHKLISDALDVGQILFNYNKYKNDLQLVSWDKTTSLDKLKNGNEEQKHLGNTLDLFLKQDSVQYNFDNLNKLYILKYKHKIIGGTSPRTLFFAAPNVSAIDIKFGNDIMLDERLNPLYKRDREYVKYLYALSKTANFNTFFPEFNSYLLKNLEKLHQIDLPFYSELMNLNWDQYLLDLENVVFNGNAGQPLEVINGFSLKQYVLNPKAIEKNSCFTIKTTKVIKGLKPLVLPIESYNFNYKYTIDRWNPNTIVPVDDKRPLESRTLPEQGDKYPYLTMSDFLADSIIKLPYDINKDKFFTVGENPYLLPLTKRFFDYFTVEDVIGGHLIEIDSRAGDGVEIKLKIPIKRGFIEYSKIYSKTSIDPKKGSIIEKSFAFSIYPFAYSEQTPITYSLGLADLEPSRNNDLNLAVYNTKENDTIELLNQRKRSEDPYITTQTIVENRFDAIVIKYGNTENYIIPNWRNYNASGGDAYEFAIDFGTTNTHIEYKIEGHGSEKAFDISESDSQIAFLMSDNVSRRSADISVLDGESHLKQEVISKKFGKNELRNSPFRTCLVQNKDVNYKLSTFVFADVNIGFDYGKVAIRKYLKEYTNLKWASDGTENNERLSLYIEELLLLCKNKVLLNDGNLIKTKVTWFYPVSMSTAHLKRLRAIWKKNYKKVFGESANPDKLIDCPESIAPFYYYKKKELIKTMVKPSVSVDIGGGTTDIMIYAEGETKLISSFRFAGNAIFGDGFNGNINSNGFVKKYYPDFKDILVAKGLKVELEILEKLYNDNQTSQDVINFFFSLNDNQNVKVKNKENLNFSKKLADESDFKIIFLLFYSSIIYHIAELMKIKGLDTPGNIVFSGTGSKTLQIIDQDDKQDDKHDHNKYPLLKRLFEAIFNNVYNRTDSRIEIKASPNPKEVTCKGGFYFGDELEDDFDHTNLVEINVGNTNKATVQSLNVVSGETIKYKDLSPQYLEGVVENVENFYKLFNKLIIDLNFKNIFDVSNSSVKVFNEIKSNDLIDYEMQGVKNLKSDAEDDDPIGETLFFFPLIGILNELANEITNR